MFFYSLHRSTAGAFFDVINGRGRWRHVPWGHISIAPDYGHKTCKSFELTQDSQSLLWNQFSRQKFTSEGVTDRPEIFVRTGFCVI